jgi:hypothetical protein
MRRTSATADVVVAASTGGIWAHRLLDAVVGLSRLFAT